MKKEEIKKAVREGYAKIAKRESSCCAPVSSCCGNTEYADDISKAIGYTDKDLITVPEGANLGLGCGNPIALASLKEGETVLDLGSGAGFDSFLAANEVGKKGKVIGVDMTAEMIEKARENAKKSNYTNVEFRLGEIENLPVADNFVDVVISNCVINLSPDKERVFQETFRVLKPGGRLMISDIVLLKELPDFIQVSIEAYIGCISGAAMKNKYIEMIEATGFQEIKVLKDTPFSLDCIISDPNIEGLIKKVRSSHQNVNEVAKSIRSILVSGKKPGLLPEEKNMQIAVP